MPLAPGAKLDDYEVLGLIGAGGMGEVYRARDLVLKREVAIKVLPATVAQDLDRLQRFEQEAQAAAALNHSNILAIYRLGVFEGSPYLVSELLKGETLRQVMQRGPIPLRKIIDYGIQIARGLSAAHERGIVHRDLKPENLFITQDGQVKILDFGLAKLVQRHFEAESADLTRVNATEPGFVMGTIGYMAPEQVRGAGIDHRADIFAVGTLLYEMLTGSRAFQHPSAAETMVAVLSEDPKPISQIVSAIPLGMQRVVHRCLEKKPEQRFQSASDLAFALEALSDSGGVPAPAQVTVTSVTSVTSMAPAAQVAAPTPRSRNLGRVSAWLAGTVALLALAAWGYWIAKKPRTIPYEHFSIQKAMDSEHVRITAISPDGIYLVSVVEDPNRIESLTLRQIPTNTEREILKDAAFREYASVMFSPDGSYIYFRIGAIGDHVQERTDLYRIPVLGGTPERVVQSVDARPVFIEAGHRVCFYRENATSNTFQFLSASADGGDERVLVNGKTNGLAEAECDPTGRRAVIENEVGKVEVVDFASGARRDLISMASLGGYLTDLHWEPNGKGLFAISRKVPNFVGQLSYLSYPDGTLRQITNDLSSYGGISLTADGKTIATRQTDNNSRFETIPLADPSHPQEHGPRGLRFFSWISNDQIVASDEMSLLRLVDIKRDETSTVNATKDHWFLEPSPCGPETIVSVGGTLNSSAMQIYKMNRDGSMAAPFTGGTYDVYPSCSPDGKWLFYADNSDHDNPQIRRIPLNGGPAQPIARGMRYILSHDGSLLGSIHYGGTSNVQVFSTDPVKKVQTVALPPDFFFFAAFSADNKAVFFTTKTGPDSVIWRQSLDSTTPAKVSTLAGRTVRWIRASPDGENLGLIVDTPQSEAVLLRDVQ